MDPNLTLLGIAMLNAFTAVMAYLARRDAKETKVLAKQVEVATNSMKDALVRTTGEAAHAAGKEEGRIEGEIKAADVAKGRLTATGQTAAAPIPVADERAAQATERVAGATERMAIATEKQKAT